MTFKPGQSGNPKGRPRTGMAFAERVRERIDPDLIIDLALRLAADESMSVDARLSALLPLIDRGFLRPPSGLAIAVEQATPQRDLSAIPLELRRQMLAAMRAAPQLENLDNGSKSR